MFIILFQTIAGLWQTLLNGSTTCTTISQTGKETDSSKSNITRDLSPQEFNINLLRDGRPLSALSHSTK